MKALSLLAILLIAPAWLHSQNSTLLLTTSPDTTKLGLRTKWPLTLPLRPGEADSLINLPGGILEGHWIDDHWTVAPSEYFDSLLFETRQGRECATLADSYLQDIYRLEDLNADKGKLIELQASVIESQNKVIEDYPKEIAAKAEICSEQKVKLKQKIRKLWKVIAVESGVVVVLVILLI